MTTQRSVAVEVAREGLLRFPDLPTRTLAAKLLKENPTLWTTIDAARLCVATQRGERKGGVNRVAVRTDEAKRLARAKMLPEPVDEGFAIHELPDDVKNWLILCDVHIPYYDKKALGSALAWARKQAIDGILLLGDICDFYQISGHERDPRNRKFADELMDCSTFLEYLHDTFKLKHLIWKEGNHEGRFARYMRLKAPELLDVADWRKFMELDRIGVEVIKSTHPVKHKELWLLHGHEHGQSLSTPVNPARGIYMRTHACVAVAHHHRTSHHVEPSLGGKDTATWSIGCLCGLHPEYRTLNIWNHGFAILRTGSHWEVDNRRIIDGEVVR